MPVQIVLEEWPRHFHDHPAFSGKVMSATAVCWPPLSAPCYLPTAARGLCNRSIGSPNRMYVRRVSGSLIFDLAFLIASPKVNEGFVKSSLTRF